MRPQLLDETRQLTEVTSRTVNMVIPSILQEGEEFSLRISVTGPDALPCENFTNRLVFEDCRGVEGLPSSYAMEKGQWAAELTGLRATGPEVALVRARVEGSAHGPADPVIESNPAWVLEDPPYRLFWGDLHVHTKFSNCGAWRSKSPEWCYAYAREVSFLDFAAIADHLRGIASDPVRWPETQRLARDFHEPGRFVTVLGFESSHKKNYGGDNNAYYLHDDAPYFWLDRDDMRGISPEVHLKELWEFLDQQESPYITIPHHTGRAGKNRTFEEDYYDPEREPLFEMFSSWGSSESRWNCFPMSGGNNDEPAYFVDALQAGCRFGVIGSSDDHATLPGGVNNHRGLPFGPSRLYGNSHKGLAAIRARELTRGALFEAMRTRDTYATTLARSLLEVRIGDAQMGQEVPVGAGDPLRKLREVTVRFTPDRMGAVNATLVRNGIDLCSESLRGPDLGASVSELTFQDGDDLEAAAIRGAKFQPTPFVAYYVRILGSDGSCQWSSPIWLDVEGAQS